MFIVHTLFTSITLFVTSARALTCSKIFKYQINNRPIQIVEESENTFFIEQRSSHGDPQFFFKATYESKQGGSLFLDIKLVDRTHNLRSQIKGKETYDLMMEHFSGKPLRTIIGQWSFSDNSKQYLHNVKNLNMSPEVAALNTWSGQQAQRYGYQYARVLEGVVKSNGIPAYRIDVHFYKSQPSKIRFLRDLIGL